MKIKKEKLIRNNRFRVSIYLAITVSLLSVSCTTIPVEKTNGTLFITNIPQEYNGMYIYASEANWGNSVIYAVDKIFTNGRAAPGLIENGQAKLSVWQGIRRTGAYNYNGTGTVDLRFSIRSSAEPFRAGGIVSSSGSANYSSLDTAIVNFVNGHAIYNHVDIVEDTVGELVILNIPEDYNGMYVFAWPDYDGFMPFPQLIALHSIDINNPMSALCGVVEDGSLRLRVWLRTHRQRFNYDLTETKSIILNIHSTRDISFSGTINSRTMRRRIPINFIEGRAVYVWD